MCRKNSGFNGDDAWKELLALKPDTSMDELVAKGYIDASKVMKSENDNITLFLNNVKDRNECRLRIVNLSEGKLCAKILVYNKNLNAIEMWTMYPNQQQADTPGKRFSTETYAIEENGVITVYLKNIPDTSYPIAPEEQILSDEKLFSYTA